MGNARWGMGRMGNGKNVNHKKWEMGRMGKGSGKNGK